jgi:hypothetical protein
MPHPRSPVREVDHHISDDDSRFSDYIVFVDESGDHSLDVVNRDYPIFALALCIFPVEEYITAITPAVRRLKHELFGHDLVVLHEHDIRKKSGRFSQMDQLGRERLMEELTNIIDQSPMTLIAVIIDKERHKVKYSTPDHPYHLALKFGLERVHHFLTLRGQEERRTVVICEARGRKEDQELELAFRRCCGGENRDEKPYPLDIVIAPKSTNSEGLQLADLVARPAGLSVLRPLQPNRAWDVLKTKLFTGATGITRGNGLKVFPTDA